MDSFSIILEVFSHLTHPVNYHSSFLYIAGSWIENLTNMLPCNQHGEGVIHWDIYLESSLWVFDTLTLCVVIDKSTTVSTVSILRQRGIFITSLVLLWGGLGFTDETV
jgi:hypothetical protein